MKKLLTLAFTLLLLGACAKQPSENTEVSNNARPDAGAATNTAAPDKPQAGDTVVYQSNTGQRFYEAKLLSIEGTRAKLQTETETIESDMADVYPIPKAGNRVTARAGDIVAARFGQTKVWPGAEVIKVGERVTIKWLSTGKSDEVAPENVLMISTAAVARVKASFPSSGK